jgi:hypothetical protein
MHCYKRIHKLLENYQTGRHRGILKTKSFLAIAQSLYFYELQHRFRSFNKQITSPFMASQICSLKTENEYFYGTFLF